MVRITVFDRTHLGQINDQVAASVVSQLLFLSLDQPDVPIKIYINSPGGVVTSGMAIYDTMQMIPSPIETWCMGQAASMGSLLLTAGTPGKFNSNQQTLILSQAKDTRCRIHVWWSINPLAVHKVKRQIYLFRWEGTMLHLLKFQAREIEKMKNNLTQIYVTHNAKDKTFDDFYNALGSGQIIL